MPCRCGSLSRPANTARRSRWWRRDGAVVHRCWPPAGQRQIKLTPHEGDETRTVVFSGDIGNNGSAHHPRSPVLRQRGLYVLTESTYGNRNHTRCGATGELAKIIDDTHGQGRQRGDPWPFAVGRTQELLYFIRGSRTKNLVTSVRTSRCMWTTRWPRRPPPSSAAICGAIWMRMPHNWCRTAPICFQARKNDPHTRKDQYGIDLWDKSGKLLVPASKQVRPLGDVPSHVFPW